MVYAHSGTLLSDQQECTDHARNDMEGSPMCKMRGDTKGCNVKPEISKPDLLYTWQACFPP